ncbi:MAG: DUF47 family protein [Myxococcales bacterium]|jgi:uncharacterized protein Yka (UPF0111/DUF47 family)
MWLQDIVNWFLPHEEKFFDFLERQARVAHQGAQALRSFADGVSADKVRADVQQLEHDGDKIVHELEEALALTFVTPLDREDIQELCGTLDDVLDMTNGTVRACALYGVERATAPMTQLMSLLVACTALLAETMPNLRRNDYPTIVEACRKIRNLEKDADVVFRDAVSALFRDPTIDAKVLLREKEVLEDLENAIDHCESVAETLIHLSIKHG